MWRGSCPELKPLIISRQSSVKKSQGAIEAIYVDRDGYLLEGTTSNLFVVRDACLITPPCDRVLPGITRQVILRLAKDLLEVVQRPIHKDEIRLLDEVFITSSVKEVIPITTVDSVTIGNGLIGPVSQKVMELFTTTTNSSPSD